MNKSDAERLRQIRLQARKWELLRPEAVDWESNFLLRRLDEALRQKQAGHPSTKHDQR
jgi:hypothetical protein